MMNSNKVSNSSKFVVGSTGGTCNYGSIITDAGAALSLNTAPTFSSLSNSGTINYTYTPVSLSGTIDGTIGLTGTTTAQTLTASGTLGLNSLTVNNTAASNPGAILTGTINITGILTLTSGNFNTSGGIVTLKSTSIANTAIVGTVGSGGSFTGTVAIERYIPSGFRAYRDMASEVYGAGSIFSSWPSGGIMTSGSGIFITGPGATDATTSDYNSGQPAASNTGLDYSINGSVSAYKYANGSLYGNANSGFVGIANTKTENLDAFSGYRVLVRGDRSFNLATTPIVNYYNIGLRMVNATKLLAVGNLIHGTVTYSSSGVVATVNGAASATLSTNGLTSSTINGFSMVANPYVCPVQWGTATATNDNTTVFGNSTNINGSYWYLDPTASATGKYIAFNAISGTAAAIVGGSTYPGSYTGTTNNAAGYIQPGQAFFVQSSSASPTVVFTEGCKAASPASHLTAIFGVTTPMSKIYLSLLKEASVNVYARKDGAAIAFASSFGNTTYGPQDALKFAGATDNLYITDKDKSLSIDGRLPVTASDVLPIALNKMSGKNYELVIDASAYSANGYVPVLKDNYRGTVKELSLGVDTIAFTVDTTITASYANRFALGFKPTTLAVNSIVASAALNNKIVTISWNTIGEKSVSMFKIEKSTDAKTFVKIGQASAKNTPTASYAKTDNSATAATTYYRIKAISEFLTVSYSNVAKLTTYDSRPTTFSVYPNPLKGNKVLNVTVGNLAAGKYTVSITSLLGQKVYEESINHQGGSATHAISISNTLAAGTYNVTVRDANNQNVYQSNISVQP